MTDATVLLRRLRLLLAVPAGVLACDADPVETPKPQVPEVVATKTGTDVGEVKTPKAEDPTPTAETPTAVADPPKPEAGTDTSRETKPEAETTGGTGELGKISGHPRFSCPTESWCGSRRVAGRFMVGESKDANCPALVKFPKGFKLDGMGGDQGLEAARQVSLSTERTKREQQSDANICCYEWTLPCGGGRPLMDAGEPLLARCVDRSDWLLRAEGDDEFDEAARGALADAWLEDARFEHASVASFARVVLELMALGAPPELIAESTQALQDEVLHAQLCFGLASRFAGRDLGPGPLPTASPRRPTMAQFAADTFIEGCVGETVAALIAMRSLDGCVDAPSRSALEVIVEDETRHAALAWRTVAWALGRDPEAVAMALREAVSRARTPEPSFENGAPDLRAYGRLSAAEVTSIREDAWRTIIEPMLDELLASPAGGVGRPWHPSPIELDLHRVALPIG